MNDLREKYWNIYQSEINGEVFIWRELTRREFNRLLRFFANDHEREEEVCKLCVLEPSNYDYENGLAGTPSVLCGQILIESGFSAQPTGKIDKMLSYYREEMNNFQNQVSCVIHEAFPALNIEEIEDWPLEKTLWYFSRAEYKLQLRGIELVQQQQQENNQPQTPNEQGFSIGEGDFGDFPELATQKAFMEGKMMGKGPR